MRPPVPGDPHPRDSLQFVPIAENSGFVLSLCFHLCQVKLLSLFRVLVVSKMCQSEVPCSDYRAIARTLPDLRLTPEFLNNNSIDCAPLSSLRLFSRRIVTSQVLYINACILSFILSISSTSNQTITNSDQNNIESRSTGFKHPVPK
jgi:hypothetical protein